MKPALQPSTDEPASQIYLNWIDDLVWAPLSPNKLTYKEALAYVDILHVDGVFCWRLPTLDELMVLGGEPEGIQWPWFKYTGKRKGDLWVSVTLCEKCKAGSPELDHMAVCLKCADAWNPVEDRRCYVLPVRSLILDPVAFYLHPRIGKRVRERTERK